MPLSAEYLWLLIRKNWVCTENEGFVLAVESSGFRYDFSLPLALSS